jgi:hypothetical protein
VARHRRRGGGGVDRGGRRPGCRRDGERHFRRVDEGRAGGRGAGSWTPRLTTIPSS